MNSLQKLPYMHRIYLIQANPKLVCHTYTRAHTLNTHTHTHTRTHTHTHSQVRMPKEGSSADLKSRITAATQYELIPIDHGFCLPETLEAPYFEWLHWPQAMLPFSEEELAYIRRLDIEVCALLCVYMCLCVCVGVGGCGCAWVWVGVGVYVGVRGCGCVWMRGGVSGWCGFGGGVWGCACEVVVVGGVRVCARVGVGEGVCILA